ncbi:MAG: hypothetical protein LBB63_04165 [Holosporaceae bacterium]|jgi:hydroxymethylglutaryl-CoA reductase (NADPH)|nr:hypothetical protein [Holosporaceae bacterium]
MKFEDSEFTTVVPTKMVGPLKIRFGGAIRQVVVPLATFEIPVWHSVKRGALVSQKTAGLDVRVVADVMARSMILETANLDGALACKFWIEERRASIGEIVKKTSNFATLREIRVENVGRLLYVRLEITTGNAAGHNMVTEAADAVLDFIISNREDVRYVSVSGNCCCDKKVSSINGILGRGKRVSAEILVPKDVCTTMLRATPAGIVGLNVKKNLLGSILAGGVRSANAHSANVILAIYLATGQDAANLVEASQGITFADLDGEDLYFSVNIPNIIVGTVGNGKELDFASGNLERLGCSPTDPDSAKRLAAVIAAAVLCSELSLMAALSNRGELMACHRKLERHGR